jgi:hypothetical protein
MRYNGNCLCGSVTIKFPFDPMMQFKCHCKSCQQVFGSSLNAIAMPKDEIEVSGTLKCYSITGGSGNALHYNFCPECGVIIYNKPELLNPMIYIPAGLLDGQIEFEPTVELWTANRPKSMSKTETTKAEFRDNGTVERLLELLENIEQREG